MRKFYTIKVLAVSALLFLSNAALAQNLKVTSNGKAVSDGDVIEVVCEVEDYTSQMGKFCCIYEWDPELEVSTAKGSEALTVTVTNIDDSNGFKICWPTSCKNVDPSGSITTNGTINTDADDLEIEREVIAYSEEEVPTTGGKIKVKLETSSESIEFTVKGLLPGDNAVGENIAEANQKATYYTLEGLTTENPTNGIFIVKKGGKSKLVYKK